MTTENNVLLAEFLGLETQVFNSGILNYKFGGTYFEAEELSFYVSWDWLMAVVDKIEDLTYRVRFEMETCFILNDYFETIIESTGSERSKMEAVYNSCVEFVKWYNSQN